MQRSRVVWAEWRYVDAIVGGEDGEESGSGLKSRDFERKGMRELIEKENGKDTGGEYCYRTANSHEK